MPLKLTREQEIAISSTTDPEMIKAILHQVGEQQGVNFASNWDNPVEPVSTSVTNGFSRDNTDPLRRDEKGRFTSTEKTNGVSKTENIGGKSLTFTAATEAELNEMIVQAHQVASVLAENTNRVDPAAAARQAQEQNDLRVADKVELDLKFRRGEISTQEYLERSGAVAEYLESHGAPVEQIAQTLQEAQELKEEQSWAEAVEQFLHSPAGATWPGGIRNREVLGLTIAKLGLTDAEDKVAALEQCFSVLRSKQMLFKPEVEVQEENEKVELQEAMAQANSPEAIRAAMEAYKERISAQGDANEAFVKNFARSGDKATYSPASPSGERRSSSLWGK